MLTFGRVVASAVLSAVAFSCVNVGAGAQPAPAILSQGDAVVTGFSGVIRPDPRAPRPPNRTVVDLTFIDPEGPSARIVDLARPPAEWNASLWPATKLRDLPAKDVGQVFGVALDDEEQPNIYLGATSAFGLNIVRRAANGVIERLKAGAPGAQWQNGQFGTALQGGPGSIYKVDGKTGAVTLFANVMLDGVPNPGAALGGLAYDAGHKQLFVSDLHTGMIHRFSTADGAESGPAFDHGVTARTAANLPPLPFDARNRPNIAVPRFDSLNPDTWGYAEPERRIWGLAVHGERLYYSVRNGAAQEGPQIWSVGILPDGGFGGDARWELDVPAQPGPYAVSDIIFSQKGAMILAQRAPVTASYDYTAFTKPGEPRVLRYWLESPDDPQTPSRWIPEPEEYAVGFPSRYRNTNGGVALGFGYGYRQDGLLGRTACEFSLWTTGQNLRNDPALRSQLEPGGPLVVHGLQGGPGDIVVTSTVEPPSYTYFIDYDDRFEDPTASGHLGGIRIRGCGAGTAVAGAPVSSAPVPEAPVYGGPGYPVEPPYIVGSVEDVVTGIDGGGGGIGGGGDVLGCRGPWCHRRRIDIALDKTAGSSRFDPASGTWTLEYRLDVTNVGMPFTPGNAVSISDPIPAGLVFAGATGINWACAPAGGNVNCTYNSTGLFNTGAHLHQLVLIFTTKTARQYENCATARVAPRPGPRETNLANNRDCTSIEIKDPPKACFASRGAVECDQTSGRWVYKLTATGPSWINSVTATSLSPGISVPPGSIPLNPASIPLTGPPGSSAVLEVCAFDSAAAASGKPYDCCRSKVTVAIPAGACGASK